MAAVAIVMGSDSDLKIMKEAAETLASFGVSYEIAISSAHRTPADTAAFAEGAEARGIQVIIAGAGAAAHLAGAIAAHTVLPVIGVPILGSALNGMDSLFATVQMPKGIPVATVAINGAANAALLAMEILGASDPEVRQKLKDYRNRMTNEVRIKATRLNDLGIECYLMQKGAKGK
ncbi:MAG: 5-(carboxyamino)imidazole ribonucleotide mutase [Solirubrobacterales bacterium]